MKNKLGKVLKEDDYSHEDIKNRAPKSLQSSSIALDSDQGSNTITTHTAGEEKICTFCWYYLYLKNRELKRYTELLRTKYKIFVYTSAEHRRKSETSTLTKAEYEKCRHSALKVREAFTEEGMESLNTLTNPETIKGDGYLFISAPLPELEEILAGQSPRHYLIKEYKGYKPAVIPDSEMQEFIYLFESMPYNIEIMEHSLAEYIQGKQKIRITAGAFKGKEGCIMRLHRNSKLVLSFGNMTVAINNIFAFPFEKIV